MWPVQPWPCGLPYSVHAPLLCLTPVSVAPFSSSEQYYWLPTPDDLGICSFFRLECSSPDICLSSPFTLTSQQPLSFPSKLQNLSWGLYSFCSFCLECISIDLSIASFISSARCQLKYHFRKAFYTSPSNPSLCFKVWSVI